MHERFDPPDDVKRSLLDLDMTRDDWVLYCPRCGFIGPVNAAMRTSMCPECRTIGSLRIWKGDRND